LIAALKTTQIKYLHCLCGVFKFFLLV